MTAEQLDALMRWIDARIEERLTKSSCGPHVSENRRASAEARAELKAAFNV